MNQHDIQDEIFVAARLPEGVRIIGAEPVGIRGRMAHFNATRIHRSDGKTTSVITTAPKYYVNTQSDLRPMSEVFTRWGNRKAQLAIGWEYKMDFTWLSWYMQRMEILKGRVYLPLSRTPLLVNTVSTFFPNADGDVSPTSVDGYMTLNNTANWTDAVNAASADSVDDSATAATIAVAEHDGTLFDMRRGVFGFDTSSIDDGDSIDSAIFTIYGRGTAEQDESTTTIELTAIALADSTALATGDWNGISNTVFGEMNLGDWDQTDGNTNDITINSSGLADIDKTGVTEWACRLGLDVDDVAPGTSEANKLTTDLVEEGTNKPQLAVTHSVAAVGVGGGMMLMGAGN